MRNRYRQQQQEQEARRKEQEAIFARFQLEGQLSRARRRVAGRRTPEPTPEPQQPDTPVRTETTKEVSQDAGMDGSGARQETTHTVSTPEGPQERPGDAFQEEGHTGSPQGQSPVTGAPDAQEGRPGDKRHLRQGTGRQNEAATDYLKAVPQGIATAFEQSEQFILSAARDGFGAFEMDAVQLDDPEARTKSVFTHAREAAAFANPNAMGPKLVASFVQILVPYVGIANRLKAAGMAGSLGKDVARSLTADAITSVVAIDPHGERLATMLNGVPELEAYIPDYLASNDEDAPRWEGMLKNMLEVGLVGGALEGAMAGLRLMRAGHKAREAMPTTPEDAGQQAVAREQAIEEAVGGAQAMDAALARDLSERATAKAEGKADAGSPHEAEARQHAEDELADTYGTTKEDDPQLFAELTGEWEKRIAARGERPAPKGELTEEEEMQWRFEQSEKRKAGEATAAAPAEEPVWVTVPQRMNPETGAEKARKRMAQQREHAAREAEAAKTEQQRLKAMPRTDPERKAAEGKASMERFTRQLLAGEDVRASAEQSTEGAYSAMQAALKQATDHAIDRAEDISTSGVAYHFEQVLAGRHPSARGMTGMARLRAVEGDVATRQQLRAQQGHAHALLEAGKSVQRHLEALAETNPVRMFEGRGIPSSARVAAKALAEGRAATLRAAVARYDALAAQGEDAVPMGTRAEQAEAAAEAMDDNAVADAAARHRHVVERLWRAQPAEGPVAMGTDTHLMAKADADLAGEVLDVDGSLVTMDKQQVLKDLARNERDALSIAPYAMREETMRGAQVETADTVGLQVAPEWMQDLTEFADVPTLVAQARGRAYTDVENVEAAKSLESLKAHLGPGFEGRTLAPEVQADAASFLQMATALANDAKRTAGRAVVGMKDLPTTWEGAMAHDRYGAYLRKLYGDDTGAQRVLEANNRKGYFAATGTDRIRMGMRQTEKAGAMMRERLFKLRDPDTTFESASRAVLDATEPGQMLTTSKGRRFMQALIHLRASGLLSGLTTHAKNVLGNTASLATKVPVSYVSAIHRNGFTAEGFRSANAETMALFEGYHEGLKVMGQMFHYSRVQSGYASAATRQQQAQMLKGTMTGSLLESFVRSEKWDINKGQAEHQAVFGQMALSGGRAGLLVEAIHAAEDVHAGFGQAVRTVSNTISAGVDLPLSVLQAEDMVQKTIGFKGELKRLGTIRIRQDMEAQGFGPGSQWPEFRHGEWSSAAARQEYMANEMLEVMEGAHRANSPYHDLYEQAVQYAQEATFMQKLDPINQGVLNAMNTKAWGAARVAFPFYTVLMNIGRTSVTYMPGWRQAAKRMSPRLRAQFEEMGRVQDSDAIAKQVVGAMVGTSVVAAYSAGYLTGGAPTKGQFRRAHGQLRQPYSIRLGGAWVGDYRELLPGVGAIMGMMADASEMLYAAQTDEEYSYAEAGVGIVLYAVKNLMSQTAISSMGEMVEDLHKVVAADQKGTFGEAAGKYTLRRAQSIAASLLPYSSFTRRVADMMDGGQRRRLQAAGVDTEGNALDWHVQLFDSFAKEAKRRFLWMSDELPDVRGWDGEVLTRSMPGSHTGVGAGIAAFLNPLSMMAVNSRDPGIRAMLDNETAPDWTDRIFHLSAAGMDVSTPLLPSEYGWLSERRGKLVKKNLDRLVAQPWFQQAGPGVRQRNALKAVFGAAERQAEAELRAIFPNVDVRLHKNLLRELDRERAKVREAA